MVLKILMMKQMFPTPRSKKVLLNPNERKQTQCWVYAVTWNEVVCLYVSIESHWSLDNVVRGLAE